MPHLADIDLALLRSFCVLIAEESVSRAADRIGIGQPAMSHALARLRAVFDDPLLVRSQHRMVPTAKALELHEKVKEILARIDRLQAPQQFDPLTTPVQFTMTATEFVEYEIFPRLMQRLAVEGPAISILVRPAQPERSLGWLETGEIDFRLGWSEKAPPALRGRPLFADRLVSIVRHDHPALAEPMTTERYIELPHVRPEIEGRSRSERAVDEALAAMHRKLRLSLRVRNYLTVPHVVAQSDLAAIVPSRLARAFAEVLPLTMFETPLKLPTIQYSIYWHDRTQGSPPHRWLRRLIADVANSGDNASPASRHPKKLAGGVATGT
jgi:DNA-binding transcriptional LysR family regulator